MSGKWGGKGVKLKIERHKRYKNLESVGWKRVKLKIERHKPFQSPESVGWKGDGESKDRETQTLLMSGKWGGKGMKLKIERHKPY